MKVRTSAFDMRGLVNIDCEIDHQSIPDHSSESIFNGNKKIVSILGGMEIDFGKGRASCCLTEKRERLPEHDLAVAVGLIGAHLGKTVPREPVFCAEVDSNGALRPLPAAIIQHILNETMAENLPLFSRVFVMEQESAGHLWRQAAKLNLPPIGVMGLKTLNQVVGEYLLSKELPTGWRPD